MSPLREKLASCGLYTVYFVKYDMAWFFFVIILQVGNADRLAYELLDPLNARALLLLPMQQLVSILLRI